VNGQLHAPAAQRRVKNFWYQLYRQVIELRSLSRSARSLVTVSTELSRVPFTKGISNITPKLHTVSILARSSSLCPTPGAMKALYQ
jgi:hypothetical protein